MKKDITTIEKDIIGEIWTSDEPYRNLVTLCDEIGSRFGGTTSEMAARDYMIEKMKHYGLRKEDFRSSRI